MTPVSTASLPVAVSATHLTTLMETHNDVTIIDVRTPAEFESAHIPGSYNVPLDLLAEHAGELASAVGGPVVLVCRSGVRAHQAEHTLRAADLPRLHVLDGGLAAWETTLLPVNRGSQRWGIERQVRGVAGGLAMVGALAGLFVWRPLGGIAAGIGGGLLVSALTDSCTMARMLTKLPYNTAGATCDVASVMQDIARSTDRVSPAAD